MILKNNNIIYKLYKGANEINKFDKDNIEAFIRIIDEYTPPTCPVVISDIQGYQGSDPEVYSLSDEKWYERNNLGQYEEYGIYETVQDLSTATYYPGKLVYYNGHQYESQNGQWVDLGEAGTSITIDSPSYIYNDSSHLFSIPLGFSANTDSKYDIQFKPTQNVGGMILSDYATSDQDDYRFFIHQGRFYFDVISSRIYESSGSHIGTDQDIELGNYYIKDNSTGTYIKTGTTVSSFQRTSTLRLGKAHSHDGDSSGVFQVSALTMYNGNTLERDFIPAIDNGEPCLFDKVSLTYFKSDNGVQPYSGGTITQVEIGSVTPIHEYAEKEEIETVVTVESLDEVECPFEGLVAIVDGTRYTYTNGEWVETIDWSQEYLTFEAIDNNTQFKIHRNNNAVAANYSLDGGQTWNVLADNVYTPAVNAGDKIMFKGTITPVASETQGAGGVGTFSSTGRYNVMGNPYCLFSGDSFTAVTSLSGIRYTLNELFRNNTNLISAENLSMPASVVAEKSYRWMFGGCTALTTPPTILPAMTLDTYCYNSMFNGCTSLTTAPVLPATSLASQCYYGMLKVCSSLSYIKMLSLSWPGYDWWSGLPATGTFVKNPNMSSGTCGSGRYPCGWTVVTEQQQA